MGNSLKLCAALFVTMLAFGCAGNQSGNSAGEDAKAEHVRNSHQAAAMENDARTGKKIVATAHKAIGTPYVLGGTSLAGFDCSGLVKWAYSNIGVTLPRTAREQSVVGDKIHNVEDMRAGDIVAFRHPKRGYHTGIYVGDGKFIHSPRKRSRVKINSLSDPYFSKTLLGARRVNMDAAESLVAQANERLDKYIAERTSLSAAAKSLKARNAGRKHEALAAKSRNAAKNMASNAKKADKKVGSKKTLDKNQKNVKGKASKTVAAKNAKVEKSAKAAKSSKATAANNAKNARAAKTVAAGKNSSAKKQASKSVSMLNKKPARNTGKRNHS